MNRCLSDPTDQRIRTAFILGAGLGTRLRPLTERMPKPLLPVGGRPIITHAMEHLRAAGVTRFIINTHHCPEKYQEAFPDSRWEDIPILFRHEPELLDTAGGIKNIEDLIGQDRRIIVYNGDIITNLPLAPLLDRHAELRTEATLALRSRGPLTNVHIDSQGFICDMRNTLRNPGVQACLFAGIYVLETAFLRRLTPGKIESIVLPLIESIRQNPRSIGGIVIDEGFWHDLGTMEEYHTLREQDL
jgi:NDP-sugar pyrophosphorylase family protein